MASNIEWTEETWNPLVGCSLVSAGCKNCYAMKMAWRLQHIEHSAEKYAGTVEKTAGGNVRWTGTIKMNDEWLKKPLETKKPTMFFVNSMSDLFHADVPFKYIDKVFAVMALTPRHTYQVLTKRPERMVEYFHGHLATIMTALDIMGDEYHEAGNEVMVMKCSEAAASIAMGNWPLKNVWLGTSVEDQKAADERIPYLLQVPAATRFLSCEPLLGPVDLNKIKLDRDKVFPIVFPEHINCLATTDFDPLNHAHIDWVIAGGESGKDARPVHPDWIRSLMNQCKEAGVPFFFKQWGAWLPGDQTGWHSYAVTEKPMQYIIKGGKLDGWKIMTCINWYGSSFENVNLNSGIINIINDQPFFRIGKNAAGRLLDGVVYNETPLTPKP